MALFVLGAVVAFKDVVFMIPGKLDLLISTANSVFISLLTAAAILIVLLAAIVILITLLTAIATYIAWISSLIGALMRRQIPKPFAALRSVLKALALSFLLAAAFYAVVLKFSGEHDLSISTAIAVFASVLIAQISSWLGAREIKEQTRDIIEDNKKLKEDMEALILKVEKRLVNEFTATYERQSKLVPYIDRGR